MVRARSRLVVVQQLRLTRTDEHSRRTPIGLIRAIGPRQSELQAAVGPHLQAREGEEQESEGEFNHHREEQEQGCRQEQEQGQTAPPSPPPTPSAAR